VDVQKLYSDIIFKRTYARTQGEVWEEAVERYRSHYIDKIPAELREDFEHAIQLFKDKKIVGSMRGLATAGKALELYPEAVYNCSYIIFNNWKAFADMFILLMLGVGVGYSVEKHTIGLPKRPSKFYQGAIVIAPDDTKEGWRDSFYSLLTLLQQGIIPKFDFSKLRPAGTPLKTFGGTASGHEPLEFLFKKTIELFTEKPGKTWQPVEVFDLANLVANAVISGGVRRSACIALVDEEDVYKFKPYGFWDTHPWRAYSNISLTKEPENWGRFIGYLAEMGTGEPGIFNRKKALKKLEKVGRLPGDDTLGTNPCGEVILRPFQTCNLTEVNASYGSIEELKERVRAAVLLGAIQAQVAKKFKGVLNEAWSEMAEAEPLLGVSLTGLRMHPILKEVRTDSQLLLNILREEAHLEAKRLERIFNVSYTAVTTVKPSGTTSQILGTTSGLHPTFSNYFIRRVRINAKDPLVKELEKYPLKIVPDIYNQDTLVLQFPLKHPNHKERNALDQLEYFRMLSLYWADHNPSCTVTVKSSEWEVVRKWLETHYKEIIGLTLLPEAHSLPQAPYEPMSEEDYNKWVEDFEKISKPEFSLSVDLPNTQLSKTYACSAGGSCEVDVL